MKFVSVVFFIVTFCRFSSAFLLDGVDDCQDDPTLKCWYYEDFQCKGVYEAFARSHCPLRCGYCPGESAPCEDKNPDCAEFGQDVCGNSNFQGYLRENCRKFCGYCTVSTTSPTTKSPVTSPKPTTNAMTSTRTREPTTLPTGADCRDVRDDCQNHLHACAGVFKTWAIKNCVRSCGYCLNSPPCEDTVDCVHLPSTLCTDPVLQDFAKTSCRKFCKFCITDMTQSVNMTTKPVAMTTPKASIAVTTTMGIKVPTKVASTASSAKDLSGAGVLG